MVQPAIEQKPGPRIDVPEVATAAQVRSYADNGYLVMPDLITAAELDELRADLARLTRGHYPVANLPTVAPDASDDEALQQVLCIHQPHFFSPVLHAFVRHRRICGVLAQIVAAHVPGWDGSVKCMQSMFFVKPPSFQGQAWHQDEIYIPTRDRSLTGAWIAIDEATCANGCMWALPGSHRTGYLYPQRQHDRPDEFDVASESFGFDETGEVAIKAKPGSVVFFNGYLLHRSRRNRGHAYRRALVNHYMNAWSLLPWHLREDETPSRADRRAIVPVAGVDPYAWKGVEPGPDTATVRLCQAAERLGAKQSQ